MDYEEIAHSIFLIGVLIVITLVILAVNGAKKRANDANRGTTVQMQNTDSKSNTYEYTIISE
jgi:Na+/H+ antiporter NhaC